MPGTTTPEAAKWEKTATTLRCASIDDHVTITITREWLSKCTWCDKYKPPPGQDAPRMDKAIREKVKRCTGPDCALILNYREKLMAEEGPK